MIATNDSALVQRLRDGDSSAFEEVFDAYHPMLVRLAATFVKDRARAEEIAQDTWVAMLGSLDSFEGRSTLKTWIARIAINRAKTAATRGARVVPLEDEATVDSSRFFSFGAFRRVPDDWDTPEVLLSRQEVRAALERCIEDLPQPQRAVVTLRDLEGWSSEEVCNALDLSESNQRVLLHRGRGRLRSALEAALSERKRQAI